jgi:hypothetical protein
MANFSAVIFPVGRVKVFNPLGHCGQPKLQAVVGSIPTANGLPHCAAEPVILPQ